MLLDETDWKIVNILRKSHVHNSTIARELELSEGAVRQRIKKLKDSGVMVVRGLINPDILENQQIVLVAAAVAESSLLETKAREIAALADVQSVDITTGRYDLLIEVLVHSNKGLVKFITGELSQVDGIATTESFIILKGYNKYI